MSYADATQELIDSGEWADTITARPWADTPIGTPRALPAGCPRHGSYLAGEWCTGCEQAEERRLNAEWDRQAGAVPVAVTVTVGGVVAWLVLTAALTAAFGPSAAALALAVTALTGGAFVLGRAVGREDATVELGDWPAPVAAQIGGDQ